ncbi:hypothetical protein [Nocardia carnea]|uniref:hypothetical protein n=1 Tax=Nocardia carnea TaxID=37328 RepID=UPI002455C177|nr:hypothetical protein [Nocardia carnea]
MRRPRAMVLDEVWRGLEGVQALSGPQGGPLRRTVKLILDPLVIRPVQYPGCAGAVLSGDGATLLAARVRAHADALQATASWFTLLKQVRRELRITEGNAQDLYFQRCFELAATRGHPDPQRDRLRAEAVLREIHGFAAGRTTQALKDHLTDPARAAELDGLLEAAWERRPSPPPVAPECAGELRQLLEVAVATRSEGDTAPGRQLLRRLIDAHIGVHTGIALWVGSSDRPAASIAAATCENVRTSPVAEPTAAPVQRVGVREAGVREAGPVARGRRPGVAFCSRYDASLLGLTEKPVPCRPALGSSASTAALGLPFDRTVYERVFTVLQVSTERADLPPIPELVTTEISRSCAPWALLDESLRVAAAAGVELALGLTPITSLAGAETPVGGIPETAAHRLVNSRWQREAYVLQARRLAIHPASGDGNPLGAIAAELRTPWRPYLRRLWVRLHGRDVRELPLAEPDELWDLLDGIARSVVLDHRARVRKVLSAQAVGPGSAPVESRAV